MIPFICWCDRICCRSMLIYLYHSLLFLFEIIMAYYNSEKFWNKNFHDTAVTWTIFTKLIDHNSIPDDLLNVGTLDKVTVQNSNCVHKSLANNYPYLEMSSRIHLQLWYIGGLVWVSLIELGFFLVIAMVGLKVCNYTHTFPLVHIGMCNIWLECMKCW